MSLGQQDIFDAALSLVQAASGDLFESVDSLLLGLLRTGWNRGAREGYWRRPLNPAVELRANPLRPAVDMTVRGGDRAICETAQQLVAHLETRGYPRTGTDPWWMSPPAPTASEDELLGYNWSWMLLHLGNVNVALNVAPAHRQDRHHLPAALNLSVERPDLHAHDLSGRRAPSTAVREALQR